jgi:hypothetical protein
VTRNVHTFTCIHHIAENEILWNNLYSDWCWSNSVLFQYILFNSISFILNDDCDSVSQLCNPLVSIWPTLYKTMCWELPGPFIVNFVFFSMNCWNFQPINPLDLRCYLKSFTHSPIFIFSNMTFISKCQAYRHEGYNWKQNSVTFKECKVKETIIKKILILQI